MTFPLFTMDLLAYWQLRERPFEATWDPRFYFGSREHDEALDRLCFMVAERSMHIGMLTGEVGCGKTLVRAVFNRQLDADQFRLVLVENSGFAFKDILGIILSGLNTDLISSRQTKYSRHEIFKHLLRELYEKRRHLVLVFDEAQEMSASVLNELKLLTNLNGDGCNYLTIVLVGQPELRRKVAQLPAIDQRISLRFHLSPLKSTDARLYLQHRLKVAGHPDGDIFSDEAVDQAFSASRGVPRELNRLAKLALELAWLREAPNVSGGVVEAVVRDLERHQHLLAA